MSIVYALFAAFFAGLTSILAKVGIKNTDSHLLTALRTIVVVIFAWFMVFIVGSQNSTVSTNSLIFLILSGLSTGGSWICYYKALQLGDVNKVVPIDKSSTVLTMVFAFTFLGEPVSSFMVAGLVFITVGTFLMIQKKVNIKPIKTDKSWLFYALLSALFASLTAILGKVGIKDVENNLGVAIRTIVVLVMAWMIVIGTKRIKEIKKIELRSWVFIGLSGLATGLSWLFFYRALQIGHVSIVTPIDKLSIVLTVAFSYFFLKEKLSKKAFLGFLMIIIGTLLLLIK